MSGNATPAESGWLAQLFTCGNLAHHLGYASYAREKGFMRGLSKTEAV
jgi:hypothetical protein